MAGGLQARRRPVGPPGQRSGGPGRRVSPTRVQGGGRTVDDGGMSAPQQQGGDPARDANTPRSVITNGLPSQLVDTDPDETQEWLESLDGVVDHGGRQRARYLMLRMLGRAREQQVGVPSLRSTDYIN